VRARDQRLLLARHPLAVVVEVGRDALELGQVLVAGSLSLRQLGTQLLELRAVGLGLWLLGDRLLVQLGRISGSPSRLRHERSPPERAGRR
jgi:hypothetical protein